MHDLVFFSLKNATKTNILLIQKPVDGLLFFNTRIIAPEKYFKGYYIGKLFNNSQEKCRLLEFKQQNREARTTYAWDKTCWAYPRTQAAHSNVDDFNLVLAQDEYHFYLKRFRVSHVYGDFWEAEAK